MKILFTEMESALARATAARLAEEHEVVHCPPAVDLREPAEVEPLLAGVQALVHTNLTPPERPSPLTDELRLDWVARGAYVLLAACRRQGVGRAVLISTLALFDAYPAHFMVDETWQPQPMADAASLAPLLAERTFREFARQGGLHAICLRVGALDAPGGTPRALAVGAVRRALSMPIAPDGYRWWLFHVADNPRFPMRAANAAPLSLTEVP